MTHFLLSCPVNDLPRRTGIRLVILVTKSQKRKKMFEFPYKLSDLGQSILSFSVQFPYLQNVVDSY